MAELEEEMVILTEEMAEVDQETAELEVEIRGPTHHVRRAIPIPPRPQIKATKSKSVRMTVLFVIRLAGDSTHIHTTTQGTFSVPTKISAPL